ncbi:MAG: hypothetical protein LBB08_00145, partial [Rickettsiales bacterium]|nr:hypothetical protein [Rickettsiales bacterium]
MRLKTGFFSLFIAAALFGVRGLRADSPVPGNFVGGNLTSFENSGNANNNQYNQLMNPTRGPNPNVGGAAKADFGNCEGLIQRCADPKCKGGCTDMGVARGIALGCVQSNASCKKYGDALAESIAGRMVASNQAKAASAANAAAQQQAAAQAEAAQQQATAMQALQQQMADQQAQS